MTRDCKHGQLARSCNICELEAENERLKAALEWLHGRFDHALNALVAGDYRRAIERLLAGESWEDALRESWEDEE